MKEPKVSVVVPCFNSEKYVEKCLESICNQSYSNLEIICVDDGSIDSTVSIIRKIARTDKRICIIEQENMFAGIARNVGISEATGEYIIFLDSDDFFDKNMIEVMVQSAISNTTDIVMCDAYFVDDLTGKIEQTQFVINKSIIEACGSRFSYADIPEKIFDVSWGVVWNKLYRMEFVKENKLLFQGLKKHNDELFVSLSMVLAQGISFVNNRFVYYRRNIKTSLQSYSDCHSDSYDFYEALVCLGMELKKRKMFDTVEVSYRDKCLCTCFEVLNRQKNFENYKNIFYFLKNTAFCTLGLTHNMKTNHPEAVEKLLTMSKMPLDEYLFHCEVENKKSSKIPYYLFGEARKIVIYAAGNIGKEYYAELIQNDYYLVAAWVDKNYQTYFKKGLPVVSPNKINEVDYDLVLIAVDNEALSNVIILDLLTLGVEKNKIVWR